MGDSISHRVFLTQIFNLNSHIVVELIKSTKSVNDKRLKIDISTINQFMEYQENSIRWCSGAPIH